MISYEVKVMVRKYSYLCSWFVHREADQSISTEQFETVLEEIGRLESSLILGGTSEAAIVQMIAYGNKNDLASKPVTHFNDKQQQELFEAVFGDEELPLLRQSI